MSQVIFNTDEYEVIGGIIFKIYPATQGMSQIQYSLVDSNFNLILTENEFVKMDDLKIRPGKYSKIMQVCMFNVADGYQMTNIIYIKDEERDLNYRAIIKYIDSVLYTTNAYENAGSHRTELEYIQEHFKWEP